MTSRTAPWWVDPVVYQVYLRSFADASGDGIGDLRGVIGRLDHIAALGADALWLTPFYPSPQVDSGYDVRDHRGVDPLFGRIDDLDALVAAAHDRGLRVLVDIVANHVSAQHPWFVAARAGGPERSRFHIRPGRGDGPPNDWQSIFGGPAWERLPDGDPADGQWYLHVFGVEQPDLNWTDPTVVADIEETLRFWLDRGVDGIRVDAAGALAKDPAYGDHERGGPHPFSDRPEVHAIYRRWRTLLDSYPGDRMAVAEAWGRAEVVADYVRPDELHQVFAIDVLLCPPRAAELRRRVDALLTAAPAEGSVAWVLGNHDLPRPTTRYGPDLARAMHLFTLALPGALYLHQGDELGLPDAPPAVPVDLDGRDGSRVPLPWTGEVPPFGFSAPGAAPPWLPQPDDWAGHTADAQRADPGSTLTLLSTAIRHRRARWAGALRWLPSPPGTLAFRRGSSICVLNLSTRAVRLDRFPGRPLLTSAPAPPGRLPAHTCVWLAPAAS